jgi:hypothetical protein
MTDGSHKTRRIGWPLYMQVYANACNQLATFSLYSFIVLLVIYFWLQFKMNIRKTQDENIIAISENLTRIKWARTIWPGTAGNRPGSARSTSRAVLGLGRQPVG